jgi:serine/threonine protein kinase
LGTGSFNDVWSLKNNTNQVLRITKVGIEPDKLQGEITGLFLQSYMSKPESEGGIGCDYICQVYEFGYVNKGTKSESVYAILESLPVSELFEKIYALQQQDPKPFLNLLKTFHQILQGLNCMHSHRYAHLDMKTENVGLDANGNAKIFDFGFARYIPYTSSGVINLGGVFGTPINMDPHIFFRSLASLKSDVYSVGIMMIETYFDLKEGTYVISSPKYHSSDRKWDDFRREFYDSNEDYNDQTKYKQNSYLIDLVKWMTYPHPHERCNSKDAMNHKWFTEIINTPAVVPQQPPPVPPRYLIQSQSHQQPPPVPPRYLIQSQSQQQPLPWHDSSAVHNPRFQFSNNKGNSENNGGKKPRKIYLKKRKTVKKRRHLSFVKSRRSYRR